MVMVVNKHTMAYPLGNEKLHMKHFSATKGGGWYEEEDDCGLSLEQ
jgi:hypothetical protein